MGRAVSFVALGISLAIFSGYAVVAARAAPAITQGDSFSDSAAAMQEATRHMLAVSAIAPKLGASAFKAGVESRLLTPHWALDDASIQRNALYVVYTPEALNAHPRLGLLNNGTLKDIPLVRPYAALAFVNNGRILQGVRVMGGVDWYGLSGDVATHVPEPHATNLHNQFTLENGDTCGSGAASSGVAIVEIEKSGRSRPELTTDQLREATHGILDQVYSVTCNHFHGENFATIGAAVTVVLRLGGHGAALFSNGRVVISSETMLLVQSSNGELLEASAR